MKVKSYLYNDNKWNQPLPKFKVSDQSFVLIFGNNLELANTIIKENPNVNFIGASSSGNMFGGLHYAKDDKNHDSLVLSEVEFTKTKVKVITEKFENYDDSFSAGQRLYKKLDQNDLAGVLTFTEGLQINGAKFSQGLNSNNSKKVPIVGGLAGDDMNFVKTVVFNTDGWQEMSVIGIGFYGPEFKMLCGSQSGITSFGIERKVSKAVKNVLYEIDGSPALDVYESFLGEQSVNLPAAGLHFPVELSSNFSQKDGLVRTPINIDRENKSIIFTGEIPETDQNGEPNYIRLMLAQKEALITASELVSLSLKKQIPENIRINKKFMTISISCAARKAVLKTDLDEEITPGFEIYESLNKEETLKSKWPKNSTGTVDYVSDHHVGFYAYGEIVHLNDECCLVNQTMSQIILFEED